MIYTNQVPEKHPLLCPWLNSTSLLDPLYLLVLKITRLQDKTMLLRYFTGADLGARAPPKIGKNKIFWRKIVIFHTKYPKNVRVSLRSAQMF